MSNVIKPRNLMPTKLNDFTVNDLINTLTLPRPHTSPACETHPSQLRHSAPPGTPGYVAAIAGRHSGT